MPLVNLVLIGVLVVKLRIISLSVGGEVALREFFSEISRKKSFKEKMVLSAAKALGSVKAKEFKEDPSIKVLLAHTR